MEGSFEPRFNRAYGNYDAWDYDEYFDERSAADFIIMQELALNVDGYQKSMHITKHPFPIIGDVLRQEYDGLVHMGPVWDFDLAFGNYDVNGASGPNTPDSGYK